MAKTNDLFDGICATEIVHAPCPSKVPMKERRMSGWPEGDKGWICVGGGRNIPGYASIKSAEIAISKNPNWRDSSLDIAIAPFKYNDGAIGEVTETRFAVLIKMEEVEEEIQKEFYSAIDFFQNELKQAKKESNERRVRFLRNIVFDVEDAYNALPEDKKAGIWDSERIKEELNILI